MGRIYIASRHSCGKCVIFIKNFVGRVTRRKSSALGKVCESLLKPVNKDGYDATGDKIEIYVSIMNSVHYQFEQKELMKRL